MTWWLDEYLQIFKGEFSPKEISLWVKSVKLMMPLSHLYWGCWSLMQVYIFNKMLKFLYNIIIIFILQILLGRTFNDRFRLRHLRA